MTARYFDVNVLVYYLTGDKTYGPIAKQWLRETDEKYTSCITPFLIAVILSRLNNKHLRDYNFVKDILNVLEYIGIEYLNLPPWDRIIEVMNKYKIDLEDAIHVAIATENKLEIVSNDEELKKKVNAIF